MENWENFGGQALQTFMCTKLYNDKSVSIEELIAALQHTSVSSHRQYQKRNFTSEMNR